MKLGCLIGGHQDRWLNEHPDGTSNDLLLRCTHCGRVRAVDPDLREVTRWARQPGDDW